MRKELAVLAVAAAFALSAACPSQSKPELAEPVKPVGCQDRAYRLSQWSDVACESGQTMDVNEWIVTCRCSGTPPTHQQKAMEQAQKQPPKPAPSPAQDAPTVVVEQPSLIAPVLVHHGLKLLLGH